MYYRLGNGVCCCILHRRRQTLRVHSPGGNTFLLEMTSWPPSWKYQVKSKIWLRCLMRIYLKNIHVEFHPDPIWTTELRAFEEGARQQRDEKRYEISSWSKISSLSKTGYVYGNLYLEARSMMMNGCSNVQNSYQCNVRWCTTNQTVSCSLTPDNLA